MADELEMELKGVNNTNAAYQGDNTDSYAKSIEDQYSKIAAQQAASVNDAVNQGTSALTYMQNKVAPQLAKENLAAAQADRAEAIERRDGIEVNNGNRQRIGHSQYDIADNTYDQEREDIFQQQRQLELDLTRQISDLRSKGEYAKADAALQNAQQKFKQLYADQMRADKNLRSNYEYGTKLKREDEAITREDERLNTKWLRSLGESFLQRGVMPSDGMLEAMGLDKDTAQLYINAVLGMYGYGGGGGGGRGRSGGGSGGSGGGSYDGLTGQDWDADLPNIWGTVSNYNNSVASQIYQLSSNGDYMGAMDILGSYPEFFSQSNAELIQKTAWKQYQSYQQDKISQQKSSSSGTTASDWTKKYGSSYTSNYTSGSSNYQSKYPTTKATQLKNTTESDWMKKYGSTYTANYKQQTQTQTQKKSAQKPSAAKQKKQTK